MYLIVGLGNPEADYSRTRHNMGFDVINKLAQEYEIEMSRTKFEGIYGTGIISNEKVILLKPQTYMNLSGESIIKFKNFYKIENNEIIVVLDDIELEPGKIRIRRKGSAGSHNGLKSVVHSLKTEEIPRIRVGVGNPEPDQDIIEYVIGHIDEEQYKELETGIIAAKDAIKEIIENGIESAMNKYN